MNQKVGEKPRLPGIIMPQLLIPTYDDLFDRFMGSDDWWLQEMVRGERRLVANEGNGKWSSWNKQGDMLELPEAIVEELNRTPLMADTVIDGNIRGEIYRPFDILRFNGSSMMQSRLLDRRVALNTIPTTMHVHPLSYFKGDEKEKMFAFFNDDDDSLGIVFKHKRSEYRSDWFKHPFEQQATFQVISSLKSESSILIGAYDKNRVLTEMGLVSIEDDREVPPVGAMVEVGYLHAVKNGGLEQPVYLGLRSDQTFSECLISKLKFKKPSFDTTEDARWAW